MFVDDSSTGGWFLFYWGVILLWVIGLKFENTWTVSWKGNISRVISRLYGWVYKTLKLSPLAVEHSVVVTTAGSQSRRSQIESYGYPILDSRFIKFVFRISGGIKFGDLHWGLRHWWSEFDYRYDGLLICLSILILCTLCAELMKGRPKALFC